MEEVAVAVEVEVGVEVVEKEEGNYFEVDDDDVHRDGDEVVDNCIHYFHLEVSVIHQHLRRQLP